MSDSCEQPAPIPDRLGLLRSRLADERSGRVVFLSHCLLNQNTRYLGGAFRPGAVPAVVDCYLRDGIGFCQLACPEEVAWGGVLKRHLVLFYGRPRIRRLVRLLMPWLVVYTRLRYSLLARRVAAQIADYRRSGFDVLGVVGVDGSPTCGVTTTLDLHASMDAVVACPVTRFDRRFMNETVVDGSSRPGRGLFVAALDVALGRRGHQVPLLAYDPHSDVPGSSLPPIPTRGEMVGRPGTR